MDLREYLFRQRISVCDFAKKISYSRDMVQLIKKWDRRPSPRLARAIHDATNGEVSFDELMSLPKHTAKHTAKKLINNENSEQPD